MKVAQDPKLRNDKYFKLCAFLTDCDYVHALKSILAEFIFYSFS